MQTYVVYYFLIVNESQDTKKDFYLGSVVNTDHLVGLLEIPKRNNGIRPFEIEQDRLYSFIKFSDELNIVILNITFEELEEPDLYDEILVALKNKDNKAMTYFLDRLKSTEQEIKFISFIYKGRTYRISRFAVAEIIATKEELETLTLTTPLAYVTGIKEFPISQTEKL